jgi:PIN domain nuclease of toxin-antitoxin system
MTLVKSFQLPGHLHNDPAERIIIATAVSMGVSRIMKNEKIRTYPHVKTACSNEISNLSLE